MTESIWALAPESLEGNIILKLYFISQSVPNIRYKLQKLGKEPYTPTTHVVKVFNVLTEIIEEKSKDKMA